MKVLKGKVVSGTGDFSYWLQKLQDVYYRKTGMVFFPGTLNIELERPYHLPSNVIRLEKEENGGTVSVSIQPCRVFDRPAYILRTDKNASGKGIHNVTIIEIATDIKLRDRYNLEDGDVIDVTLL